MFPCVLLKTSKDVRGYHMFCIIASVPVILRCCILGTRVSISFAVFLFFPGFRGFLWFSLFMLYHWSPSDSWFCLYCWVLLEAFVFVVCSESLKSGFQWYNTEIWISVLREPPESITKHRNPDFGVELLELGFPSAFVVVHFPGFKASRCFSLLI